MKLLFKTSLLIFSLASFAQDNQSKTEPDVSQMQDVKVVQENTGVNIGQDIDQQDPNLDAFYKRGSYLVYDCNTRHWVCTRTLEYKRCVKSRKEAILDYDKILPCAHFDIFVKRKDCRKRQQELTNRAKYEQFCFHPAQYENKLVF